MITDQSIELFRKAAKKLPAYNNFLKTKGFDPDSVKTAEDFKKIPRTNKKNYLIPSDRKSLIWEDDLNGPLWYCSTSGSTGEPYYFPRREELAWRGSWFAEQFLNNSSYGQGSTLVILAFGMGVWIGGIITLRSFEIAAERIKAPVSFLPTGYNKKEVLKALRKLAPQFDQTILVGYPPFVKEVIDEAADEGIDLKKLNMRLMFAAEAFTEIFRQYVCEKAGVKNLLLDTMNIYGSADMGAMAHETPLSILIRRLALTDPLLYRDMFGQIEKTPTLAQYNPEFIEFENHGEEILLTSDGAIPLIRYAIGDHGGILDYDHIARLFEKYKIDLTAEIKKAGIEKTVSKKPFVFVFERSDLSATLHGIIIYPEFVKAALLDESLTDYFTERFTMSTKNDIHHNQFLQINIELRKGINTSSKFEKMAIDSITKELIKRSSEFAEVSKSKLGSSLVQVVLWTNGHPRYFAEGTKQNWVEKA